MSLVNSDNAWLGKRPQHWREARIGYLCKVLTGGTPDRENLAYWENGTVPWMSSGEVSKKAVTETEAKISESAVLGSNAKLLPINSVMLALNGQGKTKGTAAVLKIRAACNQSLAAIVCDPKRIHYQYLFWHLESRYASIRGLVGEDRNGLNLTHVRGLPIYLPPLDEQHEIAIFLDREITKLDRLIDKKRRFCQLLDESRRAIVASAVTRGIRDTPLKPSGIEWFGDVPRHWTVNQLGRLSQTINDINHEMPDAVEEGIPLLSAKDLKDDGSLNFTEDVKLISRDDFIRLGKKIVPRCGDIVYSRYGACLGKARLVEVDREFLVSYSCVIIRLRQRIADPRFFTHLLDSDLVLIDARLRTQGIAVPDLGNKMIAKFQVPVPPIEEQHEIARWLDKEVSGLRRAADSVQLGIERLQEFRGALISAAVTGQMDVRNCRPQEADAVCL